MLLCYDRSLVQQKITCMDKPKEKGLKWKRLGQFFAYYVPKFGAAFLVMKCWLL